ncbi:hypothetical protein ABH926_007700 [Catenulispora sp. GP43]|uniref:hypothetical protein n=1 Tax=Catenulispora sp. GP43 TaxID=3156263 RepID=UPI0035151CA3
MTNAAVVRVCHTPARHPLTREASSASISHRSHTPAGFPLSGTGFAYYSVGGWAQD